MLPWLIDTPTDLLSSVRDTSLGSLVRDEVLALILRGELQPGQRINEPDVAARLGVSRVPVREALRALESSGLVSSRKHAGVFVRTLEAKEVADLYELRSLLDGHAGQRAAQLPAKRRAALQTLLSQQLAAMSAQAARHHVQGYYASNLAFHWAIVEAADNQMLLNTYRGIVQQLHLSRLKNLSRDIGMQVSLDEHAQIVAALAAGDADGCRRLLAHHVSSSHTRLVQRLAEDATDTP